MPKWLVQTLCDIKLDAPLSSCTCNGCQHASQVSDCSHLSLDKVYHRLSKKDSILDTINGCVLHGDHGVDREVKIFRAWLDDQALRDHVPKSMAHLTFVKQRSDPCKEIEMKRHREKERFSVREVVVKRDDKDKREKGNIFGDFLT